MFFSILLKLGVPCIYSLTTCVSHLMLMSHTYTDIDQSGKKKNILWIPYT